LPVGIGLKSLTQCFIEQRKPDNTVPGLRLTVIEFTWNGEDHESYAHDVRGQFCTDCSN
jgi:hypothetical protein